MPNHHAQLSAGKKNDKEQVREAQRLLNDKFGAGLAVDGIFGPKTHAAVKNYQSANNLQVDGIIGPKTWASLLAGQDSREESDEPAISDTVTAAEKAYIDHAATAPRDFSFAGQGLLDQAKADYLNREAFSYDPTGDALYGQYRDQYIAGGQRAMEDTMGRAAALTGGYGNSYAQTVGQQTYQNYMQQLGDMVPELYQLAFEKYQKAGQELKDRYSLLQGQRDTAYGEYQDRLSRYDSEQADLYGKYQDALSRQQDAYDNLAKLISYGYNPTDRDLKNAGMTRGQANAIASNQN